MGGARPGSLTGAIADHEVGAADWVGGIFGYDMTGDRAADRMGQAKKPRQEMMAAAAQAAREQSAAQTQMDELERQQRIRNLGRQLTGQGLTGSAYDAALASGTHDMDRSALESAKRRLTSAEEAARNRPPNAVAGAKIEEEVTAAQQNLTAKENQAIQSAQERLRIEHQVTAEKIAGADKLIASAQEELSLRQQLIKQERDRFLSVKERIAAMTDPEQAAFVGQVQGIREKKARGETLTADEYRFTQQWGGLREFEDIKQEQTERRAGGIAARLGFGQRVEEDVSKIQRGEFGDQSRDFYGKATQAVEMKLKDQRELKVTLERDDDQLARTLADEVYRLETERDERLIGKIQAILRPMWKQDINELAGKVRQVNSQRAISARMW